MRFTFFRRNRHSSSLKKSAFFKNESQEQSFFGEHPTHDTFFQPASAQTAIQRKSESGDTEDKQLQRAPDQKKEDDKKLMRVEAKKEQLQKNEVDSSANSAAWGTIGYVHHLNGKGQPLSKQDQLFFSERIGVDFSNVKIHIGPEAIKSATEFNAKAYTFGEHIVFNDGQYHPETSEGKKLLAHELAHVVQNGKGQANAAVNRQARPRRIRPRRTRAALLDALMQPDSPLWRQLNPDESSPVNCPATAAAVDEYLSTGRVSPAAGGDALSNFEFNTRPMTGPYGSFQQVRSILSAERSFAVIRAVRTPEYLQRNPGITRDHFFTAVNHHGQVVLVDAYGRGGIVSDVDSFLSDEGFGTYFLYNGQFRVRHIRFDDAPDL